MEIHRTLGDKVRLYRRKEGGAWHASTYLKSKEWRQSTKETSLARAKNCRTSVEMIEKHYAAHLKDMIDTSLVNVRKQRERKDEKTGR